MYGAAAMPAGTVDWSLVRASTLTGLRVTLMVKSWKARSLPSAMAWIRNLYWPVVAFCGTEIVRL